jgi:hypothetical protein
VLLYYRFRYAVWDGALVLEMFTACFCEFVGRFVYFIPEWKGVHSIAII